MRKAILVTIELKKDQLSEEKEAECINLCHASNIEIILTMSQKSNSLDPNTALRSGKLEELKMAINENEVDVIVFNNNLNVSMVSKLEEYLDIEVLDRNNLILDIFASRAKSKEAMIQVEMARLTYSLPAKLKEFSDEDRQSGALNNRGKGETRGTIIRRKLEREINNLKEELKELSARKELQDKRRNNANIKKVALVGYSNAGKSSLMNVLLKYNNKEEKAVFEKDQLFATLDTSIRSINYKGFEFLLYDTVGFVSDLPLNLIEAFKSTLKAAKDADLLVEVIDSSNPYYNLQKEVTTSTLKEIGADNIKLIEVYNKADLVANLNEELQISCLTHKGIDELLETIIKNLYPNLSQEKVFIPYSKMNILNTYQGKLHFELIEHLDDGSNYLIEADLDLLNEIKKKLRS